MMEKSLRLWLSALLAAARTLPTWGAMNSADFLKPCESGAAREGQAALKSGARALLCTIVFAAFMVTPTFAASLFVQHMSKAAIINGEAKYDSACFDGIWIQISESDTIATQEHLDARGTITLAGGSYTFDGIETNGTERSFSLAPDGDMYVGCDWIDYGPTHTEEYPGKFMGAAETGLNGVAVTWKFPNFSALNGSGTIPAFTSTEEQLKTAVPYFKLVYNDSGNVSAINWAIVNSNDTSTPLAVSYPSRVRVRARVNGAYHSWTKKNEERHDANVTLSGTINVDNFDPTSVDFWQVQFYDRTDPNNVIIYNWRFYQTLELNLSENTEPFERWRADPEGFFAGIESYGHIPDPIDLSHLENNAANQSSVSLSEELPAAYDLRNNGGLPTVRNQGSYGTCWAHAALGAMESNYMKKSLTSLGSAPDLSELHLAWFVFKDPQYGRSFPLHDSTVSVLDQGGYEAQPVAFLTRMAGAVKESKLPYSQAASVESVTNGKKPEDYTISLRIRNIYQLGGLNKKNRDLAKRLMMEYGAIKMAYSHENAGFNSKYAAYYYPTNACWGHAIVLVGWDDNFSREKFGAYKPQNDGAWLARNSWGNRWGSGGYFWISYEQDIGEATLYDVMDNGTVFSQYGHDDLGRTRNVNCQWAANAFKVREDGETLREVGFYTTDNNAQYEIAIYKFGTEKPSKAPVSEEAAATLTGKIAIEGYHTVELDNPIELTKGDWFTVVVKMTTSFGFPTAVEEMSYNNRVVINSGESFFSLDGISWTDGSNTSAKTDGNAKTPHANACIKAFTSVAGRTPDDPEPATTSKSSGGGCNTGLGVCAFVPALVFVGGKRRRSGSVCR